MLLTGRKQPCEALLKSSKMFQDSKVKDGWGWELFFLLWIGFENSPIELIGKFYNGLTRTEQLRRLAVSALLTSTTMEPYCSPTSAFNSPDETMSTMVLKVYQL